MRNALKTIALLSIFIILLSSSGVTAGIFSNIITSKSSNSLSPGEYTDFISFAH